MGICLEQGRTSGLHVRLCVGMDKASGRTASGPEGALRLILLCLPPAGGKAGLGGFVLPKSETEETGPL